MHDAHFDAIHIDRIGGDERSDDERDQVARHRDRVGETDALGASFERRRVDHHPVRESREIRGHVEGHREHRLAVGLVEARERAPGIGRFELRRGDRAVLAVGVLERRSVETVQLVVEDPREPDRDLERPGGTGVAKLKGEALLVGIEPHTGRCGCSICSAHRRPLHGQLRRVEEDLGEAVVGGGGDAHLSAERAGLQVRSEAKVVAVGLDGVGEPVGC